MFIRKVRVSSSCIHLRGLQVICDDGEGSVGMGNLQGLHHKRQVRVRLIIVCFKRKKKRYISIYISQFSFQICPRTITVILF